MKENMFSRVDIEKMIFRHLEEDLSVSKIASYFGYSESHFSRMFKQKMGMSVMEFVSKQKLRKASQEIVDGYSILEVAIKYGWQSGNGFSKAFKKEYGFSPSFLKAMKMAMNEWNGGNSMDKKYNYMTREQLIAELKNNLKLHGIMADEFLDVAIRSTEESYADVKRCSGEDYIIHTLKVAIILSEMEADIRIVEAGLLCDVWKRSKRSLEEAVMGLHQDTKDIVIELSNHKSTFLDDLSDAALLVKVAERLNNMRTLKYLDKEKQQFRAEETIRLFMPLAERIQNEEVIVELRELSDKYIGR